HTRFSRDWSSDVCSSDLELVFPVLTPGSIFATFFPELDALSADSNIDSLAQFGFPQPVVDVLKAAIPTLNELQQDAINKVGLFRSEERRVGKESRVELWS